MNTDWPLPFWIAHRGAGKLAPENTLSAFRLGASFGYTAFECDVKLSADDVPFLLHDATLDRTTNGRGTAQGLNWTRLSALDAGAWHSPLFHGVPLPRLEDIAAFCQEGAYALNVEIKPIPGEEQRTGTLVAQAVARLWASSDAPRPLLTSFKEAALEAARAAEPSLLRGLLVEQFQPSQLEDARQLGCCAVVSNHRTLDADGIRAIHAAGMKALCYTVNDQASVDRLIRAGIDGLITDAVDRFKPVPPG